MENILCSLSPQDLLLKLTDGMSDVIGKEINTNSQILSLRMGLMVIVFSDKDK